MMLILEVEATDRKFGTHDYEVHLIHEFGYVSDEFSNKRALYRKIQELYAESMKHDVLFSDYTRGDLGEFISMFLDPRGVWFEIKRVTDEQIIGAAYLTNVILHYDADSHFTVWDSVGSGREPIFRALMRWVMDRYHLKRITAEIPAYQSGTIRMAKRLGFEKEGVKRDAILHKEDEWVESVIFGILWEDLHNERWRKEWNPAGDETARGVGRTELGDVVSRPARAAGIV